MTKSFLPPLHPDDLPSQSHVLNTVLISQLEETICQKFYETCSPEMRFLLSSCHWYFKIDAGTLSLLAICYDLESYWHINNIIPDIIKRLKLFSNSTKVSLHPPSAKGLPWEFEVNDV
ncbi:MAG: hypothetical protein SAK29_29600 [Scytonema sp. PMC 1069.18]|nr:hypothetical protein [Scytonema sp. PMC 1069.18]MEC4887218.1 hypothetical protein [Scytonema sp. PMC 1070.18]